jgi:nitronate monooxygenase
MLHTRICTLFGIEHPIISAPMAGASGAELAAAVSEAGGLGMIGASLQPPEWLKEQIEIVRRRTSKPFGVGFITSSGDTETLMEVALEFRVPVISHAFADPTRYIADARGEGLKTVVQVQTVQLAREAAAAGADAITAQGMEAGGHTGYTSGTLPLVPAIVDAVGDIPVIAAGGIADGRGLAAALMLGAEGVWMGTRFVASHEAMSSELSKRTIAERGTDDFMLTRVFDIITNAPFPEHIGERVLRNEFLETWHGREDEVEEQKTELKTALEQAAQHGDLRSARILAGNSAGLIHAIEPAGEIVHRLVAEASEILRARPTGLLREPGDR